MNKRILYISNMYPSKKYKHYGIFVKNMELDMQNLGYELDKVVKTKQDFILSKVVSYFFFYMKIFFKSLCKKYDIIYVHFISHSARFLMKKKATLILHAHGNDIIADTKKDEKNKKHSQEALQKSDLVVVPSTYFKNILEKNYQVNPKMIKVYPSGGINFHIMKKLDQKKCQEELGLDKKYSYLLMVSRIEKDKGWDSLLKALHILKEKNQFQNKKLIVVGSGEEQEQFLSMIEKYHLQEEIILKPFASQKELVKYYNAAEVVIFPTKRKSESLGLVGLEAFACATPLIVCTLYGPSTYATEDNAWTYQQEEELTKTMEEFFSSNEEEKKKKIKNALETAKEYDHQLLLPKLKDILNPEEKGYNSVEK
ncbi:MAG: glycosyltransferase family 4 protein [Bacilli bacterium]|nr:glycosyltransferase family 4 protein [Bacilli bacterium]MBR1817910.1 glycosyltransferase family 4 protein [Bacilli bacterium]